MSPQSTRRANDPAKPRPTGGATGREIGETTALTAGRSVDPPVVSTLNPGSHQATDRRGFRGTRRIGLFVTVFAALGLFGGAGTANAQATEPPLVVIGIGGLQWSDVSAETTPTLFGLVAQSATASLTVRTHDEVTCPADGWLTVGAGRRTIVGNRHESRSICPATPEPTVVEDPKGRKRTSVDLDTVAQANSKIGYEPFLGGLGDDLAASDISNLAVGPGASLALTTSSGRVPNYRASAAKVSTADLERFRITLVDLGNIAEPGFLPGIQLPVLDEEDEPTGEAIPTEDPPVDEHGEPIDDPSSIPEPSDEQSAAVRSEQVAALEVEITELMSKMPDNARVLLIGQSGSQRTAHLTVLALKEQGAPGRWLTTTSTQRAGLVQLTDIGPTLRDKLGLPQAKESVGSPIRTNAKAPEDPAEQVQLLARTDGQAIIVRELMAPFFVAAVALMVLVATASFTLIRYRPTGILAKPEIAQHNRPTRLGYQLLNWAMPCFAFIPLATFLGGAMPWWTTTRPTVWFVVSILGWWTLLSILVSFAPWRRNFLGPIATVTIATAGALAFDTLTGTRMQWMSLLGDTPLVAGRFYGISNSPLALALTGTLIGLAVISGPILRRWGRLAAIGIVLAIGAGFTWMVGVPGANFGGPIAAVPGFAILALLLSGIAVTWRKLAVTVVMGVGVISLFAVIDYFRPAESQTHLGRFIGQLTNGEAWTVIGRKLEAALTIVGGNWGLTLTLVVLVGAAAWLLLDPHRFGLSGLDSAYRHAPTLKAGIGAALGALGVAICVKDSGIAMPLVAALMLGPLLLGISARASLRDLDKADSATSSSDT